MEIIARIHTPFKEKFGIPRQANRVPGLIGTIVFEEKYRDEAALKGIEGFSHLWLIWEFSENTEHKYSPTVRPPRLGGDTRMGVFATRSPFRPNPIGLSCVRLEEVRREGNQTVLIVSGVDMVDGTPIYDIKPYIPYADCHPDATGGFTENISHSLEVVDPVGVLDVFEEQDGKALMAVLSEDPRPAYQDDPDRVYGMNFAGFNVKFRVKKSTLEILSAEKC